MKKIALTIAGLAALIATPAFAADMVVKAPPPQPAAPAPAWTGFYIGGEIGGNWAHRSVSYSGNDPLTNAMVGGTLATPGNQPFFPNSFDMSSVTGGVEAGYNWQVERNWLLGIETDFSGANLKGTGNSASVLTTAGLGNNISETQSIDWYGTVRGRLGWLPSDSLLLFATGGFAYGHVANSGTYTLSGPAGAFPIVGPVGGFSFACVTGTTCFSGSSSSIRTGWAVGAGVEWLAWRNWSLKAEYQYVDLGSDSVRLTAGLVGFAGNSLPSFNANFGRDDFHVVRAGVNYHF